MKTQNQQFREWFIQHNIENRFPKFITKTKKHLADEGYDNYGEPATVTEETVAKLTHFLRDLAIRNGAFMAIMIFLTVVLSDFLWQIGICQPGQYRGWLGFSLSFVLISICVLSILGTIADEFWCMVDKKNESWRCLRGQLDNRMEMLHLCGGDHYTLERITENDLLEKAKAKLITRAAGVIVHEKLGKAKEASEERAEFKFFHECLLMSGLAEPLWDEYFKQAETAFQL